MSDEQGPAETTNTIRGAFVPQRASASGGVAIVVLVQKELGYGYTFSFEPNDRYTHVDEAAGSSCPGARFLRQKLEDN
jgi:hypothetical protein